MDELNRENCRVFLAAFIENNDLHIRDVTTAIGCSESTLVRILAARTLPTDEFLKQAGTMIELGYPAYSKLSSVQKEKLSETIGTIGGGALGFGTITAAISSLGTVSGLSAAGVTSGLAALGSVVGGGMIAGVSVAAAIPLAAGAVGYCIIKGVKLLASKQALNETIRDERWEIPNAPDNDNCSIVS